MVKINQIKILLIFLLCHSALIAQIESFTEFKRSLGQLPENKIIERFDARLIDLTKAKAPDSIVFQTLYEQNLFSKSIKNKTLQEYTAKQLLEFDSFLTKDELYDHLYFLGQKEVGAGNQDKAIFYLLQAKEIAVDLQDEKLQISINKRIGIVFSQAENYVLAKKYLFESLRLAENIGNERGVSSVCMTIGNVYKNTQKYDTAYSYYTKGISAGEASGYKRGVSGNYHNLGNLYVLQGDYMKAIDRYLDAIPINDEISNLRALSNNYGGLSSVYFKLGQLEEALFYANKGIGLGKETGDSSNLADDFRQRSMIYAAKKRYKQAYKDLRTVKQVTSKYSNLETIAMAAEVESNFNNIKKEAIISQLKAEQQTQAILIESQNEELDLQAQIQKENEFILWGFVAALIILIIVVFAFWRNGLLRKQYTDELKSKNTQIEIVNTSLSEAQKVLTIKNEEIWDSISYAKRIQAAILPSEKHLHQNLKEAFVLYMPKDIVAGDFYWTEKIEDTILFAVADCTGHGVPGAMVSVICNSALNDTINLKGLTDPGKILDETTDIVLNQFEKSEEDVKDGMDISLCSFNRKTRKLRYAGANIPLWIVRENTVIEIKATRQPVGKYDLRKSFVTHDVEVKEGDMVYMSSDGFADQFGGDRNKKFMRKNLKNLLIEMAQIPVESQGDALKQRFLDWKDSLEQIDDVCIMGVKFKAK